MGRVRAAQAVVLSQARTDPRLHDIGLAAVANGASATDTLAAMRDEAVQPHWRQLGVLLADGSAALHTGASCVEHTGERIGDGCLALGNALSNDEVVSAMVAQFEQDARAALADRLIDALDAGLAAGGETDPLRSASLLVFADQAFAFADLRIDDDPAPVAILRALWREWAPKAEGYIARTLDPDNAPSSSVLEAR